MLKQLASFIEKGFVPYIATSQSYVDLLDVSALGDKAIVKVLEDPENTDFHRAYVRSNGLAFGDSGVPMPNWVYIDCVTMQTAVIGLALPYDLIPQSLQDFYEADESIDTSNIDYLPVSGQIAGFGMDGETMVGFSLFSLRRRLKELASPELAIITKYLGFSAYKAESRGAFLGISQYDNRALPKHALFSSKMYIDQAVMPLHTLSDMTMVYRQKIELNEERIFGEVSSQPQDYDFLLRYDDADKKQEIQAEIRKGHKFLICDPVHIEKDGTLYLPVKQES